MCAVSACRFWVLFCGNAFQIGFDPHVLFGSKPDLGQIRTDFRPQIVTETDRIFKKVQEMP
jgi:hypothetical protein